MSIRVSEIDPRAGKPSTEKLIEAVKNGDLKAVESLLAQDYPADDVALVVRMAAEACADRVLQILGEAPAPDNVNATSPTLTEIEGRLAILEMLKAAAKPRGGIDWSGTNRLVDEMFSPVEKKINDLLATGDPLSAIVHAGDVERARTFFDELFWQDKTRTPQWDHLQLALLAENKPMLRFLAARGASCAAENMGELKQVTAEKCPHYAALLRACGLRVPEAADSAVLTKPKVGDKMPDGTIYVGFSPDTQKPMYAMAADAPVTVTFNRAAEWAAKLEVCGHQDWRVPTKEELNILYQNKDKGALKGTFNESVGNYWYWSSSDDDEKHACNQRFDHGRKGVWFKSWKFHVRYVRG